MEIGIIGFVEMLNERFGINISAYEDSFVAKSIKNRQLQLGIGSFAEFYDLLKGNQSEAILLHDSLQIGYSEFFRNPLFFALLEQHLLPLLLNRKRNGGGQELRIWSSACASGQEPYSLAILLREMNENLPEKINYRIFATDNCEIELGKAREGAYCLNSLNRITLKRFQSFFLQNGETYLLSPLIKNSVDFSFFDLLSDQGACPASSVYGNFDLVLCCNLLFYYKPEFRTRILEKLSNTLAPGGFLVTGETEREILLKNGYKEFIEFSSIFLKPEITI